MRVGPSVNVARVSVDEIITALWTFANAQGLLTDDINERTAAAGVTIDGVLLRDITIRLRGLALATDQVIRSNVLGDAQDRFRMGADGGMAWGDGALARDTNLFRAAANLLATDDDFRVGGAAGLLADIITERTAAAGVTIDGVRLRDIAVDLLGKASPANRVLGCDVLGDADERFRLHANGVMQWGDGTGARDTELRRDAADELGTPDDFNVGGVLDLGGDIELSSRDITYAGGPQQNVATGTVPVQRTTPAVGGNAVGGLAGGRADRRLVIVNLSTTVGDDIDLQNEDALSLAANRIIVPNAVQVAVLPRGAIELWYDGATSRWRVLRPTT